MDQPLHVLILEDNPSDAELEHRELRKAGLKFTVDLAHDQPTFVKALETRAPDLVLADYSLPGFDGLAALELARQKFPGIPVIVVSGAIGEETAIDALKAGATDYVLKQRLSRLGPVVQRALREAQQLREKRLAREELARQQELLRVTLTSIGDAVIATDTGGRVTFLNPTAEALTGFPREQALGQPVTSIFRVIDERTRTPGDDIVARVLREGRTVALANHSALISRDGRESPVEDSAAPIRDAGGNLVGVVLVFHDVTEKRRTWEALRQSEEQLRLLIAGVKDYAIFMLDLEGRVVNWTSGAERVKQWRAEEIVGRHFSVLFPPEDAASGKPQHELAMARREGHFEDEGPRLRKDGSVFWARGTVTAVFDAEGKPCGFVKVVRDISERKRAEEELKAAKLSAEQAKAAAESASRAKDHFMAVLSHELRTPLAPVVATVSMLRQDPRFDAETQELLEVIHRNAELEARLIDDLLDVTRITRGKIELDRRPIELSTIIKRATEVCMPDIEARRLHFGVDAPGAPCMVEADAARLQQVFWNLLKNAVKFTPKGGCMGVRCWREANGQVAVEVSDSGIGIEPEMMPRLFNAFEQGERSTTRQFGGLGLGLTISKAMVELHGGSIEARSEGKGKGATFTVRLPLMRAEPAPMAETPRDKQQRAAGQPTRSLRILLVEDHGDTARIMKRLLRVEGHEVESAADVATALKLASEQAFDLLLSDLGLPDGSGLELMRTLRAQGSTVKAIALSGYGQEQDIAQSREAGFAAHLTKPVSLPQLGDVIATLFGSSSPPGGAGTRYHERSSP